MKRCSQTSALISSILPRSAGCVLTSRSWTSDATAYVSSGTSVANRSAARIASSDGPVWPVAAGQDEPEGALAAVGPHPRGHRRSRGSRPRGRPGTMTRLRGPIRSSMCCGLHRPDRDAVDDLVEVGARVDASRRGRPRGPSRASGSTGSAGTAGRPAAGSRGARGRAPASARGPAARRGRPC